MPDAIIEMLVGWRAGSDMFETYQHGKSEDVDKALLLVYGANKEKMIEKVTIGFLEKIIHAAKKDKKLNKVMTNALREVIKSDEAQSLFKSK